MEMHEPLEITGIIPIDYNFCIGYTKAGKKCNSKPCKGSCYCHKHKTLFRFHRPEECPVCMESLLNENRPLDCGHWVHRECVLNWKDECPVCRQKVKLSREERTRLNKLSDIVITLEFSNILTDMDLLYALILSESLRTISESLE